MRLIAALVGAVVGLLAVALVLNVFPELRDYKHLVGLGCGFVAGRATKVAV